MSARMRTALKLGVKLPHPTTLQKYGLTMDAWLRLLEAQAWRCPICEQAYPKYVIDHEHVPGWTKMNDDDRARHVRGLTCWYDNRYLLAGRISPDVASRIGAYLTTYFARRDA